MNNKLNFDFTDEIYTNVITVVTLVVENIRAEQIQHRNRVLKQYGNSIGDQADKEYIDCIYGWVIKDLDKRLWHLKDCKIKHLEKMTTERKTQTMNPLLNCLLDVIKLSPQGLLLDIAALAIEKSHLLDGDVVKRLKNVIEGKE